MSTNSHTSLAYSPGILSLMPLFYAAWTDRVLSPTEIQLLQEKGGQYGFLTKKDRAILLQWSDPLHPPSPQLFKYWEIELRRSAALLDEKARYSLVDLGLFMAQNAVTKVPESREKVNWSDIKIRQELEALEEGLKQVSLGAYQNIFPEHSMTGISYPFKPKPGFDISILTEILDGEYSVMCKKMRNLLKDPAFQYRTLPVKEAYREQVLQWCQLLAQQGLGSYAYPLKYGGSDDMGSYMTIFEMLGYHDLSFAIKFGVQFGLFGGSIQWLGTKRHHDLYLEKTGKLELAGCFAMTETGHGSNVRGLETTASYDEKESVFVIQTPGRNAGKEYIGNAIHGKMATVFAQLIVKGKNHGVHAILVPLRNGKGELLPGVEVEDCGYKMGLNGIDNGRIWFSNVKVPRENLLNRFGDVDEAGNYSSPIENPSRRFFAMLGTLVGGRVCVAKAGLSATKSGLTIAIRYALRRRQFGPSVRQPETLLLDYPIHQRRLLPRLAKVYALHFGLDYLGRRFINRTDEDIREIETLAAGLKAYSTWFTTDTLQECREACGGKGYLAENRFSFLKSDTDIFTTFEGDNTVLMQLVAKGVLSQFKNEFHEDRVLATLRYLGDRVSIALTELNPFVTRNTDRSHLLDSEFHLSAFRYREKRMLYAVARRMREMIKSGVSSYDAFLKCQSHMIGMATAFVERVILEEFIKIVKRTKEQDLQPVLTNLYNLFALSTMEENKGWYLEHDYISGGKSKAIRRQVDELCSKIRPEALSLVDAFLIPEECLGAEIIQ